MVIGYVLDSHWFELEVRNGESLKKVRPYQEVAVSLKSEALRKS